MTSTRWGRRSGDPATDLRAGAHRAGAQPRGRDRLPVHEDWNPSLHVYPTPEQGSDVLPVRRRPGVDRGGTIIRPGCAAVPDGPAPRVPGAPRRLSRSCCDDHSHGARGGHRSALDDGSAHRREWSSRCAPRRSRPFGRVRARHRDHHRGRTGTGRRRSFRFAPASLFGVVRDHWSTARFIRRTFGSVLIGATSKARKGVSWARVREPLSHIQLWTGQSSGFDSGIVVRRGSCRPRPR